MRSLRKPNWRSPIQALPVYMQWIWQSTPGGIDLIQLIPNKSPMTVPYLAISPAKTTETMDISLIRILSEGPRRVLERIAHSVADHGGFVVFGAFAAEFALLDILLGVVPCAAGICHHHGEHKSGRQSAGKQTENPPRR